MSVASKWVWSMEHTRRVSRGRILYLVEGKGSGQEVDTLRPTLLHAPLAFITTDSGQLSTESAKPPELAAPGLQAEKLGEILIKYWERGVTKCTFLCQMQCENQTNWSITDWNRGRFIVGPCERRVTQAPAPNPKLPKGFSKAFLKARWGSDVVSCCRLLGVGIFCFYSCPLGQVMMFL